MLGHFGSVFNTPLCFDLACRLLGVPARSGHDDGVDYDTYGFALKRGLRFYEWHYTPGLVSRAQPDGSFKNVPDPDGMKIQRYWLFFRASQRAWVQCQMPKLLRTFTGQAAHFDLAKCTPRNQPRRIYAFQQGGRLRCESGPGYSLFFSSDPGDIAVSLEAPS